MKNIMAVMRAVEFTTLDQSLRRQPACDGGDPDRAEHRERQRDRRQADLERLDEEFEPTRRFV